MSKISLGCRVVDRINGFNGLVTGRLEYLNGCRQYLVKPEKLDEKGKVQDGIWIDEQYLLFEVQLMDDPFAASAEPTRGGPDRAERDLPR